MAKLLNTDKQNFTFEGDAENITELTDDIDDQINSITQEFGGDSRDTDYNIKIYRVDEGKGRYLYCFACVPTELPIIDRIRDDWGSGKFEIRIHKNKRIFRRIPVDIAERKIKPVEKNSGSDIKEIIAALAQQQKDQINQVKEMMMQFAGRQASPTNPLEMMQGLMAAMISMKQLTSIDRPPIESTSMEKSMEMFLKGMEVAKEFSGGGSEKETGMMDVLRDLIKSPIVEKILEQSTTINVPSENVSRINPNPLPRPKPHPVNMNQPNPNITKVNPMVNAYINMMIKAAKNGSSPDSYAELILDNVPIETVEKFLMNENAFDELAKINPDVNNHKDWFMELKNAIIELASDDGGNDEEIDGLTQAPDKPIN